MANEHELAAMRRAIELAARAATTTLPNPMVGCVLLAADGSTVAEGWHERAGGPHAEIAALNALAAAGAASAGSAAALKPVTTAVVTMEPCAHHGRTGPCADALLAAGVCRVVIGVLDPTVEAAGGAEKLRAAGVEVETGVLAQEVEAGDEVWLTAVRRGRPFVTWKLAATLDGRIAAADGTSKWITSAEARQDGHRLRAEVDTMLVGVGTVLADDPQLTARDSSGRPLARQPLRVVLDSAGRTPPDARIRDDASQTWIATAAELGTDGAGRVDLHALMKALHARQRRHVLLEGGPRLAGAMLEQGLVDRVVGYLAPALLGAGASALDGGGITTISAAWRLEFTDVRRIGPDVRVVARPVPASPASTSPSPERSG